MGHHKKYNRTKKLGSRLYCRYIKVIRDFDIKDITSYEKLGFILIIRLLSRFNKIGNMRHPIEPLAEI